MKLAIMQPYFLPYIGYYQLIAAVDEFVIYDNIKYTKKGWINRNRFLLNGESATFSIPLVKASDLLDVRERSLSPSYQRDKLIRQFDSAYCKAPQFQAARDVISQVIRCDATNLFDYILNATQSICRLLGIDTKIIISSGIGIDHQLRSEEKVLAICAQLGASEYLNSIGGIELYSREHFRARGVRLDFIRSRTMVYPQFGNVFVENLSIVDVLMFNPLDAVKAWVRTGYDLV
jgi:hypothetical protein